ncbi:DUF5134 domain-containing protein [Nocardia arizonensis]|uniref:DUF5134 domain-containing protein n=1 Tax=Nocardia arizonensis TaxID=1141647 RepID=UPI000B03D1A3|nr:DUF5134 domain-containing protein [Nocardia arizonensis]
MSQFVQQYAAMRWAVVAVFGMTAALVVVRLATPRPAVTVGSSPSPHGDSVIDHRESDAAHLIMCMVMLSMLVFPTGSNPQALRGVLTAMTVVFAILLIERIARWRGDFHVRTGGALGYHLLAAAAMLYAMSGHSAMGHAGPAPVPALLFAVLFCLDAVVILVAAITGRGHGFGVPSAGVMVPHVVMDIGTAYMLVGAVVG